MLVRASLLAVLSATTACAAVDDGTDVETPEAASDEPDFEPICPAIGYPQGLVVDLENAPTGGRFRAEVTVGDEAAVVEIEVTADQTGSVVWTQCLTPSPPAWAGCAAETSSFRASFGLLGTQLTVQNLAGTGGPAEVAITVETGDLAGAVALEPAYETVFPQGPDCGSQTIARESLALTPGA